MDNYQDYELTPEEETPVKIAADFPYRPGLILVPVTCDICKLLMYATEEQIGQWKICPDCGRKKQICPVKAVEKVVVEFSPDGGYQMRKCELAPNPGSRIVSDYRAIEGSVDYKADRMPNMIVPEEDIDPLEAAMDKFLTMSKRPTVVMKRPDKPSSIYPVSPPSRSLQEQQSVSSEQDRAERQIRTVPVPAILPETGRGMKQTNKESSMTGLFGQPESRPGTIPVGPPIIVTPSPPSKAKSAGMFKGFFHPFFDKRNAKRFLIDFLTGTVALYMSLNLFRFLGQFAFSSQLFAGDNSLGLKEILQFLGEYMLGMLPFGVWFVFLAINGMTIFVQTKNGDDRIETWADFRTDFAIQYFIWVILIGGISLIPGQLISAALYLQECPAWRMIFIPASLHLLFPLFFLSVTEANAGLELFHKRIWKSLFFQPFRWMTCYLAALLPAIFATGAFYASYALVACSLDITFFAIQFLFLPAAPILCQIIRGSVYFYFRLLGTLDWNLDE